MPAYNFKAQFAEAVANGSKRQTLRPPRRRATKPGDTLYLYTGMRTKACRRLRDPEGCISVQPVTICPDGSITLAGVDLTAHERTLLAQADGFSTYDDFFTFFYHQYGLPVDLELIKW